ncbi:preprotein translocase subunit SecG [Bartonella sp. DGB1]|uniref:preprotein translocase subunit SecG n=1 Tax=Bartonella sp. DGB1 TaxID=3239807 RepID=UPI00352529F7
MQIFVVIIYLFVVLALISVILLQKSDGGGFGSNNFNASRGSKSFMSRLTAILATLFFGLAIILLIIDSVSHKDKSLHDLLPENNETLIEQLGGVPDSAVDKIPQMDEKSPAKKSVPKIKEKDKDSSGVPTGL